MSQPMTTAPPAPPAAPAPPALAPPTPPTKSKRRRALEGISDVVFFIALPLTIPIAAGAMCVVGCHAFLEWKVNGRPVARSNSIEVRTWKIVRGLEKESPKALGPYFSMQCGVGIPALFVDDPSGGSGDAASDRATKRKAAKLAKMKAELQQKSVDDKTKRTSLAMLEDPNMSSVRLAIRRNPAQRLLGRPVKTKDFPNVQVNPQLASALFKLPREVRLLIFEHAITNVHSDLGILVFRRDDRRLGSRWYKQPTPQNHIHGISLDADFRPWNYKRSVTGAFAVRETAKETLRWLNDKTGRVPAIDTPNAYPPGMHNPLGLLMACRATYIEALPLLYARNTFAFRDRLTMLYFAHMLVPEHTRLIRSMRILWEERERLDIATDLPKVARITHKNFPNVTNVTLMVQYTRSHKCIHYGGKKIVDMDNATANALGLGPIPPFASIQGFPVIEHPLDITSAMKRLVAMATRAKGGDNGCKVKVIVSRHWPERVEMWDA